MRATAHRQIGTIADAEGRAIRCALSDINFLVNTFQSRGAELTLSKVQSHRGRMLDRESRQTVYQAGALRQMCVRATRTAALVAQSNLARSGKTAALSSFRTRKPKQTYAKERRPCWTRSPIGCVHLGRRSRGSSDLGQRRIFAYEH
jgi:hypothetical protein